MLNEPPKRPDQFAAETINAVKENVNALAQLPDGTPRPRTFEQAAAATQILALNAIAASLLSIADALHSQQA